MPGHLDAPQEGKGRKGQKATGKNHEVEITGERSSLSLSPKKIEIDVGDTITWCNTEDDADPCRVTSDGAEKGLSFSTGWISPSKSKRDSFSGPIRFEKAGKIPYSVSTKDRGKVETGVIVVKPKGTRRGDRRPCGCKGSGCDSTRGSCPLSDCGCAT